jgi:hypothetical protein
MEGGAIPKQLVGKEASKFFFLYKTFITKLKNPFGKISVKLKNILQTFLKESIFFQKFYVLQ